MDVDGVVTSLTNDETRKMAEACLQQLPNEIAFEVIEKWIKENEMQDEAAARFAFLEE